MTEFLRRVRCLFRRDLLDHEFEKEMASHLEFAVEANIRQGMPIGEARRQALIHFGGLAQATEAHRDARGIPVFGAFGRGVRYAVRHLRRNPTFALVAMLMLGIAIGANVAVFSVVNGTLLQPLPFRNPQQLVWISQLQGKGGISGATYSPDAFEQFQARNRSLTSVGAYFAFSTPENFHLRGRGEPLPVTGISVTQAFFSTLGVSPEVGRLFTAEECQRNGRSAVLLTYSFWQRRFAGDRGILGRPINLDDKAVTVVGVLPQTFDFESVFSPGSQVDIFVPAVLDDMRDWGNVLALVGRLKATVRLEQAQAEANVLARDLDFNVKYHLPKGYYTMGLTPLHEYVSGKLRRALFLLWGAVGVVLLIVCSNLANLLLTRAMARRKESAMRVALGASRFQLTGQLLIESFLLALAGGIIGLGLAYALTTWLAHQETLSLPLLSRVGVDFSALGLTVLLVLVAAFTFGLLPSLKIYRSDVYALLKDSGQAVSAGKTHHRLQANLVVSEIALASALLISAGLLLKSFLNVLNIDLGFQPEHAISIRVDYPDRLPPQQRTAVRELILQQVDKLPGVQAAGISDNLPLERNRSLGLSPKGRPARPGEFPSALAYVVTPGYFDAIGLHLRQGRQFDWHDRADSQSVVILNETAARQLWPGKDPLTQTALVNGKDTRVVGVVADVHESGPEARVGPQMYLPAGQVPAVDAVLVVRTNASPEQLAPSLMRTLRSITPTQSSYAIKLMQTSVDRAVSPRRFFMTLVTAFAATGVILATLGIFGVISYSVLQQTREFGIRVALGAKPADILSRVLFRTLYLTAIGIAIGSAAYVAISRFIGSLLFGTEATDPLTFAGMALVLVAAALLAGIFPAQRAARVDPIVALRTS